MQPPPAAARRRGAALTLLAALAAAVYAVAFRAGSDAPRESFALAVVAMAAALNGAWLLLRARPAELFRPSRKELGWAAAMAALTAAANLAVAMASQTLAGGAIAVLFQTELFFVALLAYLALGEKPGRGVVAGGLVAAAGVAVARAPGADAAWHAGGLIWGLAASVAFAGLLVLARAAPRELFLDRVNAYRIALAVPLVALIPGATGALATLGPAEWAAAAIAALAGPVLSRLLQMYAARALPAAEVKLGLLTTAIFAYALEAVTFGAIPAPLQIAGASLILAGVGLPLAARRELRGSAA